MGLFKSDNKSSNPTLRDSVFDKAGKAVDASDAMTIDGTIGKTGILLALVVLGGMVTWNLLGTFYEGMIMPLTWGGFIIGFVLALVIMFKQKTAPYIAPVYAIFEGLALGGISVILSSRFPGIAFEAICLTVLVATLMLILYRFRVIRVTEKFRSVMLLAVGAIAIFYVVSFVLSFFSISTPLSIANTSLFAIGLNVVIVVIAALSLLMDFDFIERGSAYGSPKYMEWYGAFGLTVTLVWLYLEILKLLARLANR